MLKTTGSFIMYTAHFYYVHNAASSWGSQQRGGRKGQERAAREWQKYKIIVRDSLIGIEIGIGTGIAMAHGYSGQRSLNK